MLEPQIFGYPADGRPVGASAYRAGYFALIGAYELAVPLPRPVFATGKRHREYKELSLNILSPRHTPPPTLEGHLTFALKYEGANPEILKALFAAITPAQVEEIVRRRPTGRYARRIWFLYEWLTGQPLDPPDQRRGSYVSALDPSLQPVGPLRNSQRHRVRNNLPGHTRLVPRGRFALIRGTASRAAGRSRDASRKRSERKSPAPLPDRLAPLTEQNFQ